MLRSSIVSLEEGTTLVQLRGMTVTINGIKYEDPTAKVTLLTFSQIKRADSIISGNNHLGIQELQDDILSSCFIEFIGITDKVDWESMEAGVVHTLYNAILSKSMSYVVNAKEELDVHLNNINQIDVFQAVISRFLMIPYTETKRLPINEVYRLYALCRISFPETELAEDPQE